MHLWKPRIGCDILKTLLVLMLWVVLNTGCSVLGRTAVPTSFPEDFIKTAIKLPAEEAESSTSAAILNPATPEVSETPIPPIPSPTPASTENPQIQNREEMVYTPLPTVTATQPPEPTPDASTLEIPEAAIKISSPGPMSKISSTLEVQGTLKTVPDGYMLIEVWLEPLTSEGQPRLLLRELQNFISDPIPFLYISKEFNIEISRLSEFAQLRVSTYDPENRIVALASVDLLLLSVGEAELNPPGDLHEQIVILEPRENELVQGGTAFVSGLVRSYSDQYLSVSLTTANGNVIGVQHLLVTPPPEGGYVPFNIEVPYNVSETTRVRLSVFENNGRIAGLTHLSSILTLVSP